MTAPGVLFVVVLALATAGGAAAVIRTERRTDVSPGVAINAGISALTGAVLLLLVAAIGVTILRIGDLLPAHYLIGFLLLGPLALKLSSTGYRFLRYYTGDPSYRQAGPPQVVLRLAAPVLVVATGAVFATGIELWLFGYRFGEWWKQAHIISFLVWTLALAVHLMGHLRRSATAVHDDVVGGDRQAWTRPGLVVGSLLLGALVAAISLLFSSPFHLLNG